MKVRLLSEGLCLEIPVTLELGFSHGARITSINCIKVLLPVFHALNDFCQCYIPLCGQTKNSQQTSVEQVGFKPTVRLAEIMRFNQRPYLFWRSLTPEHHDSSLWSSWCELHDCRGAPTHKTRVGIKRRHCLVSHLQAC